jgi:hypothetical protein
MECLSKILSKRLYVIREDEMIEPPEITAIEKNGAPSGRDSSGNLKWGESNNSCPLADGASRMWGRDYSLEAMRDIKEMLDVDATVYKDKEAFYRAVSEIAEEEANTISREKREKTLSSAKPR